ncbi:MAG: ATP synthase F1 subunit delta [Lentisphaerae bacterium]|nr:ATP synthase F1 subunit delta [Lentisphaerota bacterium]
MATNILAQRYAKAVFSMAAKHDQQQGIIAELNGFRRLLQQNPSLRAGLLYPFIPRARKIAVLDELGARGLSPLARDFLILLIAKRREHLLAEIIRLLNELLLSSQGLLAIRLNSARALTSQQQNTITRHLAQHFGQQVILQTGVDATLLGGITIQVGQRLIDGSCRGQLEKVRYELSRN